MNAVMGSPIMRHADDERLGIEMACNTPEGADPLAPWLQEDCHYCRISGAAWLCSLDAIPDDLRPGIQLFRDNCERHDDVAVLRMLDRIEIPEW